MRLATKTVVIHAYSLALFVSIACVMIASLHVTAVATIAAKIVLTKFVANVKCLFVKNVK